MEALRKLQKNPAIVCFIGAFLLSFSWQILGQTYEDDEDVDGELQKPTVFVAVLIRNKAHTLPYFFRYLQELNYPKDRMILWIRNDHSIDNSRGLTNGWVRDNKDKYHGVSFKYENEGIGYDDEETTCHWSKQRFDHVIALRQKALDTARKKWADYFFMLDADVILYNSETLNDLIAENRPIVAPLLNVTASKYYSNFWCAMTPTGYYQRTDDYYPIKNRHKLGCFPVAMVHSAVLVDLRYESTRGLAYHPPPPDYPGPQDDIIQFAFTANESGAQMYILNKEFYGYVPKPMDKVNVLIQEREQFSHIITHSLVENMPLKRLDNVQLVRNPSRLGFDQIYMINLERRPERREIMMKCFEELGIEFLLVNAIDGKKLNNTYLKDLGVKMLPNFEDPYGKRPLTMGEIGCFLSHYIIWQDVVKKGYERVIVFEDDIRFEPYFVTKLGYLMEEAEKVKLEWDLIYLGRKRLNAQLEEWVNGTEKIVIPHYSYWTLSYLLSQRGAQKLLDQKPLEKMVPVDEYLPIMFDRHSEEKWKMAFSPRNLKAYSAEPLLVYPTLYTGEPGYITDTENAEVIELIHVVFRLQRNHNLFHGVSILHSKAYDSL